MVQPQEAEASRSLSFRLAWFTYPIPGQPGLDSETLISKNKNLNKLTSMDVFLFPLASFCVCVCFFKAGSQSIILADLELAM